jgi:hypothetical protein
MLTYLSARLGERSTTYGVAGIALALALLCGSFALPYERYAALVDLMREIGAPVMVAGLVAALFPEKPKC